MRPENFSARSWLGVLLCDRLRRYEEAIRVFESALAIRDTPTLLGNLALARRLAEDWPGACDAARHAAMLEPDFEPATSDEALALSLASRAKGRFANAARLFRFVLARDAESAEHPTSWLEFANLA